VSIRDKASRCFEQRNQGWLTPRAHPRKPALLSLVFLIAAFVAVNTSQPSLADTAVETCNGRSYEVPDKLKIPCSATWLFEGACDGKDLWDRWKLTGPPHPNANGEAWIRPWLDNRIIVTGYEMVKVQGGPHVYFGIGSGIHADMFLWMGPSATQAVKEFRHGLGHPWPSKAESERQRNSVNDLLDIHGSCTPTTKPTKPRLQDTLKQQVKRLFGLEPAIADEAPEIDPASKTVHIYLTIYYYDWKP
jgi:hypothetical protein